MIVVQRSGEFGLVPVSESKVSLRLQREIGDSGELRSEVFERLVSVIRDFDAVAKSAGAERLVAVATSAIRNTARPQEVVERVEQETGVKVRVLSGREEADATFRGAVSSMPVNEGVVVDIGGGSMEVVRFEDRSAVQTVTLPLGALKLSDRFFEGGKVTAKRLARLAEHVESTLSDAGVEPLVNGGQVIGTGGTVRNAGKIDRRRNGGRFGRLHGHRIAAESLNDSLRRLAEKEPTALRNMPGLNPERADSIVGGIAALNALVKFLGSDSLLVSGSGLREGLALEAFGVEPRPVEDRAVQSVRDMCRRFSTWDEGRAARRSQVAERVAAAFTDFVTPEIAEALRLAAEIVDAGSGIDYYQRYAGAALLVVNSNAGTLTHRQIALVAAVCAAADGDQVKIAHYGGQIAESEITALEKSGVLLRIADEIEMRLGNAIDQLHIERPDQPDPKKGSVRISFGGASNWRPASLMRHHRAVFGGPIELSDDLKV